MWYVYVDLRLGLSQVREYGVWRDNWEWDIIIFSLCAYSNLNQVFLVMRFMLKSFLKNEFSNILLVICIF